MSPPLSRQLHFLEVRKVDPLMAATSLKSRTAEVARAVWKSRTVVVANVRANDTKMLNQIRSDLSAKNHKMKFVKNAVARKAVEDMEERRLLGNLLHGQVFLIYSDDEDGVSALKEASTVAENYPNVALLGAAVDNTLLTMEGIREAIKLPPLQQVHGDFIGALLGPSFQLASVLEAPKREIAGALARSLKRPSLDAARAMSRAGGSDLAAALALREASIQGDESQES